MNRFILLKKDYRKNGFSLQLKDVEEDHIFWIDCWLIDGYGNTKDYKTTDLYIDWEFNQYIFNVYDEKDTNAQKYQENDNNINAIIDYIDEVNNDIISEFLKSGGVNNEK